MRGNVKDNKKYSRVYIEITNACNMSCSFCLGTSRKRRMMTVPEFERVTEKLVGLTDYIYLHVLGEPLTHPELPNLIRIAAERGFKCAITTNGTLLDKRGDEIIEAGVYKVNISLHSFEGDDNEKQIEYVNKCMHFADKASSSGVLTVFRLWNRGKGGGKNDATLTLLREGLIGEWRESDRGFRIRHKLHLEWGERFEWPRMDVPPISDRVFCYGLGDHFGILSDGTVIPCCLDREGDIPLGNAFDDDIKDILSSERALRLREGFTVREAREELCKRCGYARRFD